MNFENMQDLSLEEQINVLKEIKANFENEKNSLKHRIFTLEDDKKLQEKIIIKSISSLEQKAKVSETISAIKSIKNALSGKDTELKLVLNAIENAEKLLEQKQKELSKKKSDEDFKEAKRKYNKLLEEIIKFRQERENRKEIHQEEIPLSALLKNVKTNKLEDEIQQTEVSSIARQKSQEFIYKTPEDIIADIQYSKQQQRTIDNKDYLGALEATAMPGYTKVEQSEEPEHIRAIKYKINDEGFSNLTKREKTQYESWREEVNERKDKIVEYEKMDDRN